MTNRLFPALMLSLFILFVIHPGCFSQEKTKIRKIVIDAGHGGNDPGALGRKAKEKNITLAIALKLGKLIRQNAADIEVIYTRDTDVFVELFQRAEIANKNKADLFISIHCNANRSRTYQGAETYVMGLHKTQQNLEISKLENASILMEPDYLKRYDGFDPSSDESYITFTLFQNAYLNQSTEFAAEVQNEMKDRVGMDDRGVRQAGFLVLYKTTMPAVLIETGFLSNPEEESYLMSETGQEHIANAIFRAVMAYKSKIEKTKSTDLQASRKEPDKKTQPVQTVTKSADKNASLVETPLKDKEEKPKEPAVEKKSAPAESPRKTDLTSQAKTPGINSEIWFCVQVATSPTDIGTDNKKFAGLGKVSSYHQDGLYKYIVGRFSELAASVEMVNEIRKKGFSDAFVVAFRGNERITIQEARRELSKQKTR